MPSPLLRPTDRGLYCEVGDFYIDPWVPVPNAVVTHAHGDHLTWGCDAYLVSEEGRALILARLNGGNVESLSWGERRSINGVTLSFHPAGHILGSAQIRLEYQGEVWVVSGDYKTAPDRTCTPFELVRCDVFVTECTFGLPVYRWPPQEEVRSAMLAWIARNRSEGVTSILLAYPLGKSQRLLGMLDGVDCPIWTHGASERMTAVYREQGIVLPPTIPVASVSAKTRWSDGVVIGPPSIGASPWLRRFGDQAAAFCSGWMLVRGVRRRRNVDRGFVVSDHVDWPAILDTVAATGAERVYATHGFTDVLSKYLSDAGYDTGVIPTRWKGDSNEQSEGSEE